MHKMLGVAFIQLTLAALPAFEEDGSGAEGDVRQQVALGARTEAKRVAQVEAER